MAEKALPIVFFNLCGEMIYVIQQRLEAQNISVDKSQKVTQDIISTMISDQFVEELFKPQNMYSRSAMQSVFEKLVHSSIMRLNTNSMSKLYDLMLMVFKYQVMNCEDPEDILLVTLNHLDAIKNCAKPYPELRKKLKNIYSLLNDNYKDLAHKDFVTLYNCIMIFLQDLNIRVSVLMKLGLQSPSGEIIRHSRDNDLFKEIREDKTEDFCTDIDGKDEKKTFSLNSLDINGDRGISLGTNIYLHSTQNSSEDTDTVINHIQNNDSGNFRALEEITLLSRLIGKSSKPEFVPHIVLPSNDIEERHSGDAKNVGSIVNIHASQVCLKELGEISNNFFVEENEKDKNDILTLLDTVNDAL